MNAWLKPFKIGHLRIDRPVFLAPMTGVTDVPMRALAQSLSVPLVVSEMVAGKEQLRGTSQSDRMAAFSGTNRPHIVQLAGREPEVMAEAARLNADRGVDIIDINFGCPAKKVVGGLGGAAILRDEALAGYILEAVVAAVDLPVTLKFRLGWDETSHNAVRIARIARNAGISMLTLHGRTRSQFYDGRADWAAVGEVRAAVDLPLIVNGDIRDVETAQAALRASGAEGIMVGRACLGRPWLPGELAAALSGEAGSRPSKGNWMAIMIRHVEAMLEFHGEYQGLRIARKHVAAYLQGRPGGEAWRMSFNRLEDAAAWADWRDALLCVDDDHAAGRGKLFSNARAA